MTLQINLPNADRTLENFTLGEPLSFSTASKGTWNRIAYSAAHVVADATSASDWHAGGAIDWDATIAYRHYLWDLGLGVAEAMDTAQRGMGLGWPEALELIQRSSAAAASRGDALIASGVGTDHLDLDTTKNIDEIIAAYEMQLEAVENAGSRVILMASRALARVAQSPDDYATVYGRILSQVKEPVILHWLGDMFDPALAGYWGSDDDLKAMDACLDVINAHADKVGGIKISLLDKNKEIFMRRKLPASVRMYTGDDFNYAELIAGDEVGHSDALLGIFDAIAPAASAALHELTEGSEARFHEILEPTVPLSRKIFEAPTRYYKTGVVFLSWLNGMQDHFAMIGGQQSARSIVHLAEVFRLASEAGLLAKPELAVRRMEALLTTWGIEA